ncbi:MAG TPA: phosphonate ABC transporter ATP-binding protein [Pirellulales bacterium]|nr:phosphonate ABC transporter ATP-binding protein [Pirellulales bacterium]
MSEPQLRLENLSVAYPQTGTVLSAVSLAVRRGEFVVLLGRSGAGKSSLLRAVNYLVRPRSGSIVVEGIGALGSRHSLRAHRRNTGMVFQQHQLVLRLSALDNVLLGCVGRYSRWRSFGPMRREDVALAFSCLKRVGLAEQVLRRADELSGGQRQRVGIARALAQRPALLLVDEPVASLDPQTADTIMGLLHEICRTHRLTALVSLHQLDLARRYADRIVGLAGGHVVFDGRPSELEEDDLVRIYGGAIAADNGLSKAESAEDAVAGIPRGLGQTILVEDD